MTPAQTRDALVREMREAQENGLDAPRRICGYWADRLAALPVGEACPYVRSGDEGTHYCTLSGPDVVPAWQPIETCPQSKDVLLAGTFDGPHDWRIKVGHRASQHELEFGLCSNNGFVLYGASWSPSHWMPLPARPDAPGEKGT